MTDIDRLPSEEEYQAAKKYIDSIPRTAQHELTGRKTAIRDADIVISYSLGKTLEEVAAPYEISRERARQIINSTPWDVNDIKISLRTIAIFERARFEKYLSDKAYKWSQQNLGKDIETGAEGLGISPEELRKALGKRSVLHTPQDGSHAQQRWTDEDLLQFLRNYHAETGDTTAEGFEKWSVAQGGPTKQTPRIRFGRWANALEKAGISGTRRVERIRTHSSDDLWAAVVEFFSFSHTNYSFAAFNEWLESDPDKPSGATIRQRLELPWNEIKEKALKIVSGDADGISPRWIENVKTQRNWKQIREAAQVHNNFDPVELIKEAMAEAGEYITVEKYNRWAKTNNQPYGPRLMKSTSDSWTELVRKAGGRTGTRGRKVSPEEGLEALVNYIKSESGPVTYEKYNAWARNNSYPLAQFITNSFGSWEAGKAKAYARITAE